MNCNETKLLSDVSDEITLRCDTEENHRWMHHDSIHDVYWPVTSSVREPMEVYHKKYIYDGKLVPATLAI